MSINKVIVYGFFVVMSAALYAMEEKLERSQELKKSQSLAMVNKSSDVSVSPYTLSFSLPTFTTISNSVSSLTATVNNYWYDTEAFKKLGWPKDDILAQQELEKTQEVYRRMTESLQNRVTYNDFMEDYNFINRRQQYCQRVLQALPNCPQGVELALFCLKHHRAAMNSFDLTRFLIFVEAEQEKSKQVGAEFSLLTILPEEDNQSLDKLFKQTLAVKKYPNDDEKNRKEEAERKKKEEEEKKQKEEEKKQKEEAAKKNGKK